MAAFPDQVPVAIIGGGSVGLICSILLSLHGIKNAVFERHPRTAIHPKAVGLHQRTAEVFAKCGILDTVYNASSPDIRGLRTAWYTSLGPKGREIVSRYAWGGGPYAEAYERASPCRYVLLPQIRLEPILLARARELDSNSIYYDHDVTDVVESPTGVTLTILDRTTSTTHTLQAAYALACDGGRSVTTSLGIGWNGEADVVDMVAAHFRAPLTQLHPDPRNFITWFVNPELGVSINTGYLYHLGPYDAEGGKWGTDSKTEEWNLGCAILPHEEKHFNEEDMLKRLHAVLQIPDLEPEILSVSHWFVNSTTAESFHSHHGRVFLVGDAAHKMPPWGALGLNTGVADADNICWKLAWTMKYEHPASWRGLLESYNEERRPIAARNSSNSLHNMRCHGGVLDRAIGVSPSNPIAENVKAMDEYFEPASPSYTPKREAVGRAMDVLDLEFYAHGVEHGWFYPSADLNHEGVGNRHGGQLKEDGSFEERVYHPSTIPGHHLPHAWLEDASGRKSSTRDLVKRDKMVLVAEDKLWRRFEHEQVEVVMVGQDSDWKSTDNVWDTAKGISSKGAILVRPDGIVAWRWQDEAFLLEPESRQRSEALIDRILKRI